uniref:Uncharacterized protein n=1 Tax=Trieres chinensis TaxID=1514140 RepID=A0A7S2ETD3_TRICV
MQDLIDAKNEIQVLSQRKLEVEHNLRTSQFRENEATVFLRQFRRFYRRLLRNKAAQGTGDTAEITAKVPGVPDLNDLIDVDTLLLEAGLIEEEELHDDATVGTYRPSSQALLRSTAAAKKAANEASALERAMGVSDGDVSDTTDGSGSTTITGSSMGGPRRPMGTLNVAGTEQNLDAISEIGDGGVSEHMQEHRYGEAAAAAAAARRSADDLSSIGERLPTLHSVSEGLPGESGADAGAGAGSSALGGISEDGTSLTDAVSPQSILSRGTSRSGLSAANVAHRQKILRTPSGRLTTMREKDLERDLLQMTERCIELQIALNEEKANVDVLTNRSGSLSKKRLAQEAISLRQALDRKTHDLQAIIWKMNELHLINKTYNEKMANREQHVTYLEENLIDLQSTNRRLIAERQEAEKKLRTEVDKLKVLVDGMSVPLWQFGQCSMTERTLANRMLLPVRGRNVAVVADAAGESDEGSADGGESDSGGSEEEEEARESKGELADMAKLRTASASSSTAVCADAATQTDMPRTVERGVMTDKALGNGFLSEAQVDGASGVVSRAIGVDVPSDSDALRANGLRTEGEGGDSDDLRPAARWSAREAPKDLSQDRGDQLDRAEAQSLSATERAVLGSAKFPGGRPASYRPRRVVRKVGPTIKPGVLKESKKKSGGSVASMGSRSTRDRSTGLHHSSNVSSGRPSMRKSRGEK